LSHYTIPSHTVSVPAPQSYLNTFVSLLYSQMKMPSTCLYSATHTFYHIYLCSQFCVQLKTSTWIHSWGFVCLVIKEKLLGFER
jgi:hypothetical protein